MSGLVVTNNTIFNVGDNGHSAGGPIIIDSHVTMDNNDFNNNIFANTQGGYCFWEYSEGGTFGTNNRYYNNEEYNCGGEIWISGSANHIGTQTGNPLFVNDTGTTTGDYHLQATSPAIHNGTPTGAPSIDFDGVPRPQGGSYDIGAYQFVGSTRPNPPTNLTATPH